MLSRACLFALLVSLGECPCHRRGFSERFFLAFISVGEGYIACTLQKSEAVLRLLTKSSRGKAAESCSRRRERPFLRDLGFFCKTAHVDASRSADSSLHTWLTLSSPFETTKASNPQFGMTD